VDEFSKIAREVKFGTTSIRKYVSRILVGDLGISDEVFVQFVDLSNNILVPPILKRLWGHIIEVILRAISLTTLSETAHSVPYKLM
jgi:hypothetical protein